MNCPECDGNTKVVETRGTRRRRECLCCKTRFTTEETIVVKARQPREKVAIKKAADLPAVMTKQKAKMQARRALEEKKLAKRGFDDWFSEDNDFLPDA